MKALTQNEILDLNCSTHSLEKDSIIELVCGLTYNQGDVIFLSDLALEFVQLLQQAIALVLCRAIAPLPNFVDQPFHAKRSAV